MHPMRTAQKLEDSKEKNPEAIALPKTQSTKGISSLYLLFAFG